MVWLFWKCVWMDKLDLSLCLRDRCNVIRIPKLVCRGKLNLLVAEARVTSRHEVEEMLTEKRGHYRHSRR